MKAKDYLRKFRRVHAIPLTRQNCGIRRYSLQFSWNRRRNRENHINILAPSPPVENIDDDFGQNAVFDDPLDHLNENDNIDEDDVDENEGNDKGTRPLYECCPITHNDSQTIILSFLLRHNMPLDSVEDLITVVNCHLRNPILEKSKYKFFSKLSHMTSKIIKYHFCQGCKNGFGSNVFGDATCIFCHKEFLLRTSNVYYAHIGLKDQMEMFLNSDPKIIENIEYSFLRHQFNGEIRDYRDGEKYQMLRQIHEQLFLTVSFCSDGVKIQNSGSMWPFMYILNDLPPKLRFRNMFLSGIWSGDSDAPVEIINKIEVEELNKLSRSGLQVTYQGKNVTIPVFTLMGVFDSGARYKFQGLTQYTGRYGCSFCYETGIKVGPRQVYPYNFPVSMRTDHEYKKDIQSLRRHQDSRGVKYVSPFILIDHFLVTEDFNVDYMHNVLLGVVQKLCSFWFDNSRDQRPYGLKGKISQVDSHLTNLQPPSFITRRPRSVSKCSKWKANEVRNFLLYYSAPVLSQFLPPENFRHFCLLVNAIWTLSTQCITAEQIESSGEKLRIFVEDYEKLYGLETMLYNVHLLLHIKSTVIRFGPLWCHSMFPYETFNMIIGNFVRAARHPQTQVIKKYILMKGVMWAGKTANPFPKLNYCKPLKFTEPLIIPQGSPVFSVRSFIADADVLEAKGLYDRIKYKGIRISVESYDKPYKFKNHYLQLKSGHFIKVKVIIKDSNNDYFLCCDVLNTIPLRSVSHIRRIMCQGSELHCSVLDVKRQCMFMQVGNIDYLAVPPNFIEMD